MISGLRVIALVPARGGSKKVKRKNVRMLGGKPLVAWPVHSARESPYVDRILVSTDDDEIATAAREAGADIHRRPVALAGDSSLVIDTVRLLKRDLGVDHRAPTVMLLLEATSPFRSRAVIARCLERLAEEDLDSIATFSPSDIAPQRLWRLEDGRPQPYLRDAVPWMPRQSFDPAYVLNAVVYAFRLDRLPDDGPSVLFGKMGAEVIPGDDLVDIDTERDFLLANVILGNRLHE